MIVALDAEFAVVDWAGKVNVAVHDDSDLMVD